MLTKNSDQDTSLDCVTRPAFIALGANLSSMYGNPTQAIFAAIDLLGAAGLSVCDTSFFYHTPAFPVGNGPDYVNAVVAVKYAGESPDLLDLLHQVEAQMGRTRQGRWNSRVIDLDLIARGDEIWPNRGVVQHWIDLPPAMQQKTAPKQCVLPHPRIQDRAFVLVPLTDIAPNWRHPVLGQTATQMRDALPAHDLTCVRRIIET